MSFPKRLIGTKRRSNSHPTLAQMLKAETLKPCNLSAFQLFSFWGFDYSIAL